MSPSEGFWPGVVSTSLGPPPGDDPCQISVTVWSDDWSVEEARCFLTEMFSEGRVNEPTPRRGISRRWWVVLIVGLVLFVAGLYALGHNGKSMHRCWDGVSAEICPPSGVSQGDP